MNYMKTVKGWQSQMEAAWRYNYHIWTFPFDQDEDGWISVAGHEIYKESDGIARQQAVDEICACIIARADGTPDMIVQPGEPTLGKLKADFLVVKVDR